MKPFELMQCPLHGVNLIEASAGTGKTYTLTRLFLRLILERELRGEEILIVTFTEAATEELKGRLRNTIRDTLKAITSGRHDEPLIQALIRHTKPTHLMADRLNSTLRTFDEVSVFTIHSFCRRMLQDNAFESGSLFDTELITDQDQLVQEIVDDFWRKHVYQANPMFISFLESRKNTPETLSQLLSVYLRHPDVHVIPDNIAFHDMSAEENALRAAFDALKTAWLKAEPEIADILYKHPGLNHRTYSEKAVFKLIDHMNRYLSVPAPGINLVDRFDLLTTSKLQESVKKNCTLPEHSFFALCDMLSNSYDTLKQRIEQNLIFLKTAIFNYTKTELPKKKRGKNVYFFDDLLLTLRAALRHEGSLNGGALGQQIRRKYKAALIDEFQDTDPVQWEIFKTVFAHKDSALFLIGDPKQAIYGFRGADVFTYINAARSSVPDNYTLLTNYRSEPALIQAVNTLFKGIADPFVFKAIPFYPVKAQEGIQKDSLTIYGQKEPPMRLWVLLNDDNSGKPISKEVTRNRIASAVAGEIERLIATSGQVRIGSKPLQPAHIAVIVRKHSEARLIQAQLIERNIPCVLDSQENLFDTQEVAELERVLEAVLKPGQIELTLSSLATTILGGQAEVLDALFNDQNKWEEVMIQFRQFRHLWEAFGFMRCFRQILSDFKVRQRLLAYKDGERRITNLLHIGEVLQQKSVQEHTGMAGLVKWLKYQRLAVVPRLDEHVIRLDRDTDAVKVVTMHKSKGLEYPVVFCPFAWTENDTTLADTQTFHDSDGRLILDVGSSEFDSHSEIAAKEALAENIRLLYVALTRAVNLCYLVWGTINKTETSSLAYLFHNRGSVEDFLQNNILKNIEHARFMDDLKRFEKASDGTIAVSVLPSHEGKSYLMYKEELPALKCLTFSGSIQKDWHIRSFSSLVLNRPFETPKDHDEIREIESQQRTVDHEETLEGIFAFPKGARAGTFLHDILEHLDFTAPDYTELVSEKLAAYGFGQQAWTETICAMVHNVLNTQLAPGFITLSCVENKMRLNELEFYFPIHSISPARLGQIFKIHGGLGLPADFPERIGSLNFSPCRGFMKGFMDMVFCHNGQYYLADWKSNFLGRTVLDYNQRALTQTMEAEVYILQYIIYTLALHEYLTLRLPGYSYDKHFGGAFYIFLRGVNPEYGHQYGIYHDKPELALIEALREELI